MINWKAFEAKYENREQWAFEQMTYFLFCIEINNITGVFRYKNQTGIETEPVEKEGVFYGFQSKYYTTSISQNKNDIIDSIKKAKLKNKPLNVIYFYLNKELSESNKKDKKKPQYQIQIENEANKVGIKIEWRVKSHLEFQLSQPTNNWIANIFAGANSICPEFFKNQIEKEISNLGPRFNEELNFELPIAKLFDVLSHNNIFFQRFLKTIDNWLTEKSYRKQKDNKYLSELEQELETIRKELLNWITRFEYSIDKQIQFSSFLDRLQQLNEKTSSKRNELYEQKDWKGERNKFENELGRLREIENENYEFLKEIEDLKINLANNPTLIIQGDAGCGKSHLLGDIARQRKNQSLPTILLLGTTFNNSYTIEKNILNILDLKYSFKEFLTDLNNIGLFINSRVLILIDAINEGAGVDLWKNQIAGFINEIQKYPAIGLVLSIRNTYFDDIIPKDFKTNSQINIVTHVGFKGNEYEALKLFSKFYGLTLPNFPILNPEYSNPLFLHLICEYSKNLPEKCFPKGFNGITKIYNSYKEILDLKFGEKRHEYKNRKIVTKAIEVCSDALFNTKYGQLELTNAIDLFDDKFPRFPHLLTDLIEESVFVKMRPEYEESHKDFISFSYQKLGDFFMTEDLLLTYSTKNEFIKAFTEEEKFKRIRDDYQWQYNGIVEIFAVLLPEKFDLELFELIELFYNKNEDKRNKEWERNHTFEAFTRILLDSLKWRDISCINEEKITDWLVDKGRIDNNEWLYALTELSATPNHPFNSDRLHGILMKQTIPKRDSFWQEYLKYYNGHDDNNLAFPLRRLIDWAWSQNISSNADNETTRLVAQTLVWVLASSHISLRDQTTKALVNLLEQQSETLITILKSFEKVDDLYISERLYAVAYGCILRTKEDRSVAVIAQYVYDIIFKENNPPTHILLRDYARNTIEYAIYKNIELELDLDLIRPPYNSKMPNLPQCEDDVKEFHLDYESPDFKKNHGSQQNAIYSSVISGIADFGRYIVDSAVNHFASYSFREDETYESFLKSLKKEPRELVKILYECTNNLKDFDNRTAYQKRINSNYSKELQKYSDMLEELKTTCLLKLKELLDKEQIDVLETSIIPYFNRKLNVENRSDSSIRYWIVKRVFELGYNKNIHGDYDRSVSDFYYSRHGNKVERIGKKYQWIAFHEILAMLSDNYKINDGWSSSKNFHFYKGAWQFFIRNIDPAYITKNIDSEEESINTHQEWWENDEYTQWNLPDSDWVQMTDDLIDPKTIIEKTDSNNEEWLHLQYFVDWTEPKKIGIDRYEGRRKQIHYIIQGLLVRKSARKRTVQYLMNQNFWGRWLPENRDDYSKLINREKFWSPAYLDTYGRNKKYWETIQDTKLKVIVATESANGGIEGDKSGANQSYNIPCKYIFNKMNLQYSPVDGNLENCNNEIVSMNTTPSGVLIKKKEFIKFLDANNLDIIWTLLGEKFSFDNRHNEESYFKVPCGVYYLENSELKGQLKMYDRN